MDGDPLTETRKISYDLPDCFARRESPVPRSSHANGMVSSAEPANANIPVIQPEAVMRNCASGAKMNCPNEPPAEQRPTLGCSIKWK